MKASAAVFAMLLVQIASAQQIVDPDFKPHVAAPAYPAGRGPTVAIDEGHGNFHTVTGRYKPFADLLTSDGYRVVGSARVLEADILDGFDVLVIANAESNSPTQSAFTDAECEAVAKWVNAGGALLLIADHAPFGAAAAPLAKRFGVEMGQGWVFQPSGETIATQLVFSRENGLLGEHPILHGRTSTENIRTVRAFTGQSLTIPSRAHVLLKLPPDAREAANTDDLRVEAQALRGKGASGGRSRSVADRAQGIALTSNKGRVVILGEAAMFSAQVIKRTQEGAVVEVKAGMNVPGYDDRQLALNVLHWLSGAIE